MQVNSQLQALVQQFDWNIPELNQNTVPSIFAEAKAIVESAYAKEEKRQSKPDEYHSSLREAIAPWLQDAQKYNITTLVDHISRKIFKAESVRQTWANLSSSPINLSGACYQIAKTENQEITTASFILVKIILNRAFSELTTKFDKVDPSSLKTAILLFGAPKANDMAYKILSSYDIEFIRIQNKKEGRPKEKKDYMTEKKIDVKVAEVRKEG